MARTLKSVTLINVKAIKYYKFEFPEYGVIRFKGDNSQGKSILPDTTKKIYSVDLNDPDERKAIVNWDASYAQIIYERYDGYILNAYIHLQASQTYVELVRPTGERIKRYLTDKNIDLLIKEFGWHYLSKRDISLNHHHPHGPLLYINTSPVCNFEAMSSALTNAQVDRALENIEETLKNFKTGKESIEKEIAILEARLVNMKVYNIEKEEENIEACTTLARQLTTLKLLPKPPVINVIPRVYNTHITDVLNIIHNRKSFDRDLNILQANLKTLKHLPVLPNVSVIPKVYDTGINNVFNILSQRQIYDSRLANSFRYINILSTVPKPPKIDINYTSLLALQRIPRPPYHMNNIHEIISLKRGTCPVCNRRWVDE